MESRNHFNDHLISSKLNGNITKFYHLVKMYTASIILKIVIVMSLIYLIKYI